MDYAIHLRDVESWYDAKVTNVACPSAEDGGSDLDIFKNVYKYDNELYIFLVNSKNPGRLPVFNLGSYDSIIYWKTAINFAFITEQFDWEINQTDLTGYRVTYDAATGVTKAIQNQKWLYEHMNKYSYIV